MGQTFEAPATAGRAARPDPAVRRAAQRVDDARRLGRHARAARQWLALDPPRARAAARALRARGPVAARHRHDAHPGVRAAREPALRRPDAERASSPSSARSRSAP